MDRRFGQAVARSTSSNKRTANDVNAHNNTTAAPPVRNSRRGNQMIIDEDGIERKEQTQSAPRLRCLPDSIQRTNICYSCPLLRPKAIPSPGNRFRCCKACRDLFPGDTHQLLSKERKRIVVCMPRVRIWQKQDDLRVRLIIQNTPVHFYAVDHDDEVWVAFTNDASVFDARVFCQNFDTLPNSSCESITLSDGAFKFHVPHWSALSPAVPAETRSYEISMPAPTPARHAAASTSTSSSLSAIQLDGAADVKTNDSNGTMATTEELLEQAELFKLRALNRRDGYCYQASEVQAAVSELQQALSLFCQAHGGELHEDVAYTYWHMSDAYRDGGDLDSALWCMQQYLRISRALWADTHEHTARAHEAVATVHWQRHEWAEALQHWEEAVRIGRATGWVMTDSCERGAANAREQLALQPHLQSSTSQRRPHGDGDDDDSHPDQGSDRKDDGSGSDDRGSDPSGRPTKRPRTGGFPDDCFNDAYWQSKLQAVRLRKAFSLEERIECVPVADMPEQLPHQVHEAKRADSRSTQNDGGAVQAKKGLRVLPLIGATCSVSSAGLLGASNIALGTSVFLTGGRSLAVALEASLPRIENTVQPSIPSASTPAAKSNVIDREANAHIDIASFEINLPNETPNCRTTSFNFVVNAICKPDMDKASHALRCAAA